MNAEPFDFADAQNATREASIAGDQAEAARRKAAAELAGAERNYRVALSKTIVRLHADEKVAWSVASDVARGTPEVADLRFERDVLVGVLAAHEQAAWRVQADRRDLSKLIDWSARLNAQGVTREPSEVDMPVIGRRAA